MSFLAGPFELYLSPYAGATPGQSAVPLGKTRDGIEIEIVRSMQPIAGDNYGAETIQDFIMQGGNCFLNFTLIEWNASGMSTLLNMYGSSGYVGPFGCSAKEDALQLGIGLISTACGTNITPDHYHFEGVVIPPNSPIRYALSSRLREVPFRLQALPYDHSGNDRVSGQALGGSNPAWYVADPTTDPRANWP